MNQGGIRVPIQKLAIHAQYDKVNSDYDIAIIKV